MQYLMILSHAPDAWTSPEAPQSEDWGAYTQALVEAGIMVSGAGLQGVETATTVRMRSGERLLTPTSTRHWSGRRRCRTCAPAASRSGP
jgi:hypothetical protein